MGAFPKFDTRSALAESESAPATVAIVATVNTQIPQNPETVAGIATVAALDLKSSDFEERAAIIEYDGEIPREWAEGLARLCVMPCPEGVSEIRWRQVVDDAGRFADNWAAKASALGWTAIDIFGVDRRKPEAAIHTAGLIWLLGENRIIAISADAVAVETSGGARQSFCPSRNNADNGRRVLLWDLGDDSTADQPNKINLKDDQ
jgi:hypothetical protein